MGTIDHRDAEHVVFGAGADRIHVIAVPVAAAFGPAHICDSAAAALPPVVGIGQPETSGDFRVDG